VRTIAEELIAHNHPKLVEFARRAMITLTPTSRVDIEAAFRSEPELVDPAAAIAEAGARIAGVRDFDTRERRKAAVLERYVYGLVLHRHPDATTREAHVRLTENPHSGRDWTGLLDVVAAAEPSPAPFEAYECKFGGGVEQDDVDQLGDLWLTALEEERDPRPTVATMGSERQIRERIRANAIELDEVLYFVPIQDLPILGARPASYRLR
jgi:hypothetical protein